MPEPLRLTPTCSVAEVLVVVPIGAPETEAPIGFIAPASVLLGPTPIAGELVSRLNQSRMTWACAQLVKNVSESCGTCLKIGSVTRLPPPRPVQGMGRMLFVKVTVAVVTFL